MEIGNLLFGNSRGRFHVERGVGFENELSRLFDAYSPDRDTSWREYGEEFENDTFAVFPYYWGDCTCGYERRWSVASDAWEKGNPHADNCYQIELKAREGKYDRESGYAEIDRAAFGGDHSLMSGFDNEFKPVEVDGVVVGQSWVGAARKDAAMDEWRKAYDKRQKFMEGLYRDLCAKYKQSKFGCAVHCTCGRDKRYAEFLATDQHDAQCPIVRPNFLYKPTGLIIDWYKYPLRDSYSNQPLELTALRGVIDACVASVGGKQAGA
jgi:hypothetical protein